MRHSKESGSQLVLLPEMPFHPWLPRDREVDPARWQVAVEAHDRWAGRLVELEPAAVAGTRPEVRHGRRLNVAFVREPGSEPRTVHAKGHLPDEPGFWEASWYERGTDASGIVEVAGARAGFLVCTELWFFGRARSCAAAGAHLLLCPRATPAYSADKWLAGGRAAAVVAGAYGLSSNRGPDPSRPRAGASNPPSLFEWAGKGWAVGPDGDVMGLTSPESPFLTVEVDLASAEAAKSTYPRYVDA